MSALILALPTRLERPEPINFNTQGTEPMPSKLQTGGWIAFGIAAVMLATTALASFSGGLHIEAGGVQMTMQADLETGVQLIFAAAAES